MFERKIIDDKLSISNPSLKNIKPGGILCPICHLNPAQIYLCPNCGKKTIFPCPNCMHSELRCPFCYSDKLF